ncbi:MAG: 50S ribosomal protein L11 methyltransferase [Proteobacteria bacterium]|nr:50S ribosomal protein L11 methyltransferase [Pseudomonadota bacterium]MBU4469601.1 50S ribosomal protein L11 methyltransferase [Pseudomonadota bacterium]MCG2753279.1 50S ribosomal protein L11 methyltransferase [Desulfobacteraceae bacterium]
MNMQCPANPYGDLYIYYLEGRLDHRLPIANEHFIGNWEEDGFNFLFFSAKSDEAVERVMALQPGLTLLDRFQMTYDEWHGDAVSSFCAGDFLIDPPWAVTPDSVEKTSLNHHLLLDPGVVFGTGTHPTTKDCLTALQLVFQSKPPQTTLDIGTGTGILALAAGSLGCPRTLAVDLNLLSVKTAHRNILLNAMEDRILAVCGSAENFMDYPVDFMIANIHYDVMRKLIESKGFYKKKEFILSGLMKSEARAVKETLLQNHAEITQTWDQNGIWVTFLGKTS